MKAKDPRINSRGGIIIECSPELVDILDKVKETINKFAHGKNTHTSYLVASGILANRINDARWY